MVECLLVSLTEAYYYKISNEESKYMVNKVPSTALLYKLLMQKVIIDTREYYIQIQDIVKQFINLYGNGK